MALELKLLTDPFLQLPTPDSVRVVWFTAFAGLQHRVVYGQSGERTAIANTNKLSRTREDRQSQLPAEIVLPQPHTSEQASVRRGVWRHEALISNLVPGERLPYRVTSVREDGTVISSEWFTLAAQPLPGTPLKILLTSDHQLKPMVAANLQKVVETVGRVDAVFFAGDLANIPDRASEWFDDRRGGAFFPCLQGRASYEMIQNQIPHRYTGGEILQHAPLFTAIGNHEVMGRYSRQSSLADQFNDAVPRKLALEAYPTQATQVNPGQDPTIREGWILDHSFNTTTYEEIFTLPQSPSGGKRYYAVTFGDVRLIVLDITHIWRVPGLGAEARGKYRERERDLEFPERWGYGQHIFEPIFPGSPQYEWLQQELNSPDFHQARFKVAMFHHPPHSLGENSVPAYTDPLPVIQRHPDGQIQSVRYEYPRHADYIVRDVVPLLEAAGVQLVFFGHSHLWNRFVSPQGTHFLESSNVGNSYGAYVGECQRQVPPDAQEEYAATGNPNGLDPVVPTLDPLLDATGQPLPYIASNQITVFSILDTATGTVSSYRFDTTEPRSPVIRFDEFTLKVQ